MRKILPILALLAPAAASAQNLLNNPGFETGLSNWRVDKTYASSSSHTGSAAANLSPGGGNLPGSDISQSFSSSPGMCEVSFWLAVAQPSAGTFAASFGESLRTRKSYLSLAGLPAGRYKRYSFIAPMSGLTSFLYFSVNGPLGSYLLDDVSVIPVPEPAPLAALGIGALVLLRRRKR